MVLPNNWREQGNSVARLIAQAWMDEEFKARFMREPLPVLADAGIEIPDGLTVEVVEGLEVPWKIVASADAQGATYSINIPARPSDISDDQLSEFSADRAAVFCLSCYCCC